MKNLGYSLMEILAVIGIVLVVVALSLPAISSAKESAKQRSYQSHLRQLHLSTLLYRQEWNGDGVYGDAYQMGQAPSPPMIRLPEMLTLRCSRAGNELFSKHGVHYYSFWLEPTIDGLVPKWSDYAVEHKEQAILFAVMNHNEPRKPLIEGAYITRLGIGILEGGAVVRIRKKGDWLHKPWWNTP